MQKTYLIIVTISLLFSCKEQTKNINKPDTDKKTVYVDKPFVQEYHDGYIISKEDKAANDVRAITVDNQNNVWIAAKAGVYQKKVDTRNWEMMIHGSDKGPAFDIKTDNNGKTWAATWNGVYTNKSGEFKKLNGLNQPIAKIVCAKEGVYALGPLGIWLYKANSWTKKNFTTARSMRAALSDGNSGLWIGTDVGLYHCNNKETIVYQANDDLISAYVKGLAYSKKGNLWIAGLGGITIRDKNSKIGEKLPKDGITNAYANVVKRAPDGRMWVGTDYGITRFIPGNKDYSVRLSKRWLMSDLVRDIAFDKKGAAWIATANGVSAIKRKKLTLSQKADFFYDKLIRRHVRSPWIVNRFKLVVPGDTTTIQEEDDDNDGEYTGVYLAMESFRYAVTNNPQAKERAEKAFDFLQYLREVTEIEGFFARTIIPVSWKKSHDMDRKYTPQQIAEDLINNPRQKLLENNWHISKNGKWKWKGDTSSDELCGHLFGYYCYYTFVADKNEKLRVANHFGIIMDHLIKNNFNLTGVDGKHTKWGVWSPKIINNDPEWAPEKALNSLELLSFLKFTYHITKNEKYQKEYLKLINDHGYLENIKKIHNTNPAWETYFDIYMALYVYPPLLKYEKDPLILKAYKDNIDEWFNKYKATKSPLVNFVYNYLRGGNAELNNSVFFLKDAPLDLVDWRIDNGKREDLQTVRKPILEVLQVNKLRPPSEYRTIRWDRNPYYAVSGNPSQERDPTYWLLPYWMGRYLKLIKKNSNNI